MASITKVGKRFRAQIRRKGVQSIARTFATRREAEKGSRQCANRRALQV
jgi:hypothetical protein